MAQTLDQTDRQLIALLRTHARMPIVDIARKLGVARATVQNRMRKLELTGVILGYTVVVRAGIADLPVRALMSIACGARFEAKVIQKLRGLPAIVAIHHTTGQWDVIAEIRAESLMDLNRIVSEIRVFDGITKTETNVLMDSYEAASNK